MERKSYEFYIRITVWKLWKAIPWESASTARFFLLLTDETIEYRADLAYLVDETDFPDLSLTPEFESDSYFLTNHDFEMNLDSTTGGTWESVSGEIYKLKNVIDENSPSGYQYLKVLPAARGIKQDVTAKIPDLK